MKMKFEQWNLISEVDSTKITGGESGWYYLGKLLGCGIRTANECSNNREDNPNLWWGGGPKY
jgi:hypothetical protein